jgi:hypothetical protein
MTTENMTTEKSAKRFGSGKCYFAMTQALLGQAESTGAR